MMVVESWCIRATLTLKVIALHTTSHTHTHTHLLLSLYPLTKPRWKWIGLDGGDAEATLLYFGVTAKSDGVKKCGVSFTAEGIGKHDGSVNGKRYFQCKPVSELPATRHSSHSPITTLSVHAALTPPQHAHTCGSTPSRLIPRWCPGGGGSSARRRG